MEFVSKIKWSCSRKMVGTHKFGVHILRVLRVQNMVISNQKMSQNQVINDHRNCHWVLFQEYGQNTWYQPVYGRWTLALWEFQSESELGLTPSDWYTITNGQITYDLGGGSLFCALSMVVVLENTQFIQHLTDQRL